jgi:hypothetical protein
MRHAEAAARGIGPVIDAGLPASCRGPSDASMGVRPQSSPSRIGNLCKSTAERWDAYDRIGWDACDRIGWDACDRIGWDACDRVGWDACDRVGWDACDRVDPGACVPRAVALGSRLSVLPQGSETRKCGGRRDAGESLPSAPRLQA